MYKMCCIYLLVDFGELFQIILKERDLLFLGNVAKSLFTVKLCTLKIKKKKYNMEIIKH